MARRHSEIPFTYLWSRTTQERDKVIYENPAQWWDYGVNLKANKLRFIKEKPVGENLADSMYYLRLLLRGQSPRFVGLLTNVPPAFIYYLRQTAKCPYHAVYIPRLAKICRHTLPKELPE